MKSPFILFFLNNCGVRDCTKMVEALIVESL